MSDRKHIVIIAGELSGDQHAAKLVRELTQIHPEYQFSGIGGDNMRAAGVKTVFDFTQHAIMGFIEVVKQAGTIFRAWHIIKRHLQAQHVDLLILVDYPGFNLRVAKYAKQTLGIKVLYYISPQIWAWKYNRINTIRDQVDHMAVILPFEVTIYHREKVPASYVGHPLLDCVKPSLSRTATRTKYGIPEQAWVIGLLPGSRSIEINRLLPIMLTAAKQLKRDYPEIRFLLPLAASLSLDTIQPYLKQYGINVTVVEQDTYNAMACCDCAIVASGTATLETALLGIPMVIIYKVSFCTYWIARYFILRRNSQVNHFGLCNIIAQKSIVPELLQAEANAKTIIMTLKRYKEDPAYYQATCEKLQTLHNELNTHSIPLTSIIDDVLENAPSMRQ